MPSCLLTSCAAGLARAYNKCQVGHKASDISIFFSRALSKYATVERSSCKDKWILDYGEHQSTYRALTAIIFVVFCLVELASVK